MKTVIIVAIIVGILALAIGLLVGYILRKNIAEKTIGSAETKAMNLVLDAENRAEAIKKEMKLEAKEEIHKMRSDMEKEIRDRRNEVSRQEKRINQKEDYIDKKVENIEKKEESITRKENGLIEKGKELDRVIEKQMAELEKISLPGRSIPVSFTALGE